MVDGALPGIPKHPARERFPWDRSNPLDEPHGHATLGAYPPIHALSESAVIRLGTLVTPPIEGRLVNLIP